MTSRNELIAENSRQVIGSNANGLGVVWSFTRLTSKYGAVPAEWEASATDFDALDTSGGNQDIFDAERQSYKRGYVQRLRARDDNPSPQLVQGDLVYDVNGVCWGIIGVSSSGPGTVLYSLSRETGMLLGPDRKGKGA